MSKRLSPYGSVEQAGTVAKVGKSKASAGLAARMPSSDVVAKVGKGITPDGLAARMPSPEVAAKVGNGGINAMRTHRVVRRSAGA